MSQTRKQVRTHEVYRVHTKILHNCTHKHTQREEERSERKRDLLNDPEGEESSADERAVTGGYARAGIILQISDSRPIMPSEST